MIKDDSRAEDEALRTVALENARSILVARDRAEAELRQTQQALRASQERLEAALAAGGAGTFRWEIESNRAEWDGNLAALFGIPSDVSPQPLEFLLSAVHHADRSAVSLAMDQGARESGAIDLDFRTTLVDGSVRWLHQRARRFGGDDGQPLYVTGACIDITAAKQAAEAVRQSEARLRAVFNQAAVGIAMADVGGRFVNFNPKFAEILGYPGDELAGKTFGDITYEDDLPKTDELIHELVEGRISHYAIEKRYVKKDGSPVWCLATVALVRDADGAPGGFVDVIEDITARKQAEEALLEETRVLELLNEAGMTLASSLSLQDVLQSVTDAATKLSRAQFGAFFYNTVDENGASFLLYTLSGASRKDFDRFGNPRATALFGPTFRGEGIIRLDDVLADPRYGQMAPHHGMPKGHLPVRSYLAVPVRSRSGEVLGGLFFGHPEVGVFTERSERLVSGVAAQASIAMDNARLYEAAQRASADRQALLESERAARSAAERMSHVKDVFLATLSHELRTPLNAIIGWSQILRTNTKDREDLMRGLEVIDRNARVQTQLIEDLLDMSRIESGKLRLDIQTITPITFIEAALETFKPAADAKEIRLETFLDPHAGPIPGDPNRLQQVIWNLLSNAIKFTPKGGKLQVVLQRVNSHVEISVADTGVGIRAEVLPHVFDRFWQGDASAARAYGGLGLGLSIVKSLVELHGGTVRASSGGEGLGTTITIQLPVIAAYRPSNEGRQHPQTDAMSHTVPAGELQGLRVLAVDDQPDARETLRRLLEDAGADVITAASADEALEMLVKDPVNVLITDIGMPGRDGFELLKLVRGLSPERVGRTPAIALTAFARSEDRTRALRAGFQAHVVKPVDPAELIATVASVSGRMGPQR